VAIDKTLQKVHKLKQIDEKADQAKRAREDLLREKADRAKRFFCLFFIFLKTSNFSKFPFSCM